MITVYGDMLFAVNFFMDFLLLKATALINKRVKTWRICAGALLGAVYATTVFFLQLPFLVTVLTNIISALVMIITTFGIRNKKLIVKNLGVFYGVSFLACGIILPVFLSGNAFISNGTVYFSAGVRKLIFGGVGVYIAVKGVCRVMDIAAVKRMAEVNIKVQQGDRCVSAVALNDTGNSLVEPFTGLPVCILQREKYEKLINGKEKIYIIPYKTVSGERRVMTGIKPDAVTVTDISGKKYSPECIVAVTDIHIKNGTEAIINPCMLTGGKRDDEHKTTEKLSDNTAERTVAR